jgi:NAD(P)-dependent dehydrogenase (short-subunit alcohol dehydrogenase family)
VSAAAAIQPEGLTGKRALVSGGTRGIGAAVAARLKGAGAHVTAARRLVFRKPPALRLAW